MSFESAAAAAAASDDGSMSDSGTLSSGRSTPRGGLVDRGVLDLILSHQREANDRLDKIHADSASRTAMASFRAIGELRQGAESPQSHMAMQPIMMSAMRGGQAAAAAALAYQMTGAASMRTEHASRHLQLQQQLASGLAPPINIAKPETP